MKPGYNCKQIPQVSYEKFIEIITENSLSWKLHSEAVVPELRAALYAIRSFKMYVPNGTIKMVYHSYVLSIKTYGLTFQGNCPHTVSI